MCLTSPYETREHNTIGKHEGGEGYDIVSCAISGWYWLVLPVWPWALWLFPLGTHGRQIIWEDHADSWAGNYCTTAVRNRTNPPIRTHTEVQRFLEPRKFELLGPNDRHTINI
jgi:hypothetical protein